MTAMPMTITTTTDDKVAGADRDHDEHEGHNEFHVTYALDCDEPASLTAIDFDYFKMFAGAHDLTVNVVTRQGAEQLRGEPRQARGSTSPA